MVNIEYINGSGTFKIDGVTLVRNFHSYVSGGKLRIVNAYDTRNELLPYTLYSEISVNGQVYGSAVQLAEVLAPILFSKQGGSGSIIQGAGISTRTVLVPMDWSQDAIPQIVSHLNSIAFQVGNERILIKALKPIGEFGTENSIEIHFWEFKPGKGNYGQNGNPVTASDLEYISYITGSQLNVIEVGDLGSEPIEIFTNDQGPYSINTSALNIFEGTRSGQTLRYIYTGNHSEIGFESNQTDSQDWIDWSNFDIQKPTLDAKSEHNETTGKQGGQEGEYYHLTLNEKNNVEEIPDIQTAADNLADTVAEAELDIISLHQNKEDKSRKVQEISGTENAENYPSVPALLAYLANFNMTSSREVKIVPNTSEYTFATEDFINKFLVFTGGTSINAFVPSTRTDTTGEVQGITLGNTILNFQPYGDATVTPTIGALPKTVGDGSVFGIKMPIEDDYRVFGTLELENPVSADIDASNIVSGTISYERLPGGISAYKISQWDAADNYSHFRVGINGGNYSNVISNGALNFAAGTNVSISKNGNTITINATGGGTGAVSWSDVTGKPTTFPPSTHSHSLSQIPKVVTDVGVNQSNGNLVVSYSDGTSSEKSFGNVIADQFNER